MYIYIYISLSLCGTVHPLGVASVFVSALSELSAKPVQTDPDRTLLCPGVLVDADPEVYLLSSLLLSVNPPIEKDLLGV